MDWLRGLSCRWRGGCVWVFRVSEVSYRPASACGQRVLWCGRAGCSPVLCVRTPRPVTVGAQNCWRSAYAWRQPGAPSFCMCVRIMGATPLLSTEGLAERNGSVKGPMCALLCMTCLYARALCCMNLHCNCPMSCPCAAVAAALMFCHLHVHPCPPLILLGPVLFYHCRKLQCLHAPCLG